MCQLNSQNTELGLIVYTLINYLVNWKNTWKRVIWTIQRQKNFVPMQKTTDCLGYSKKM